MFLESRLIDLENLVDRFVSDGGYRSIEFERTNELWRASATIDLVGGDESREFFDEIITDGLFALGQVHAKSELLVEAIEFLYRRLSAIETVIQNNKKG